MQHYEKAADFFKGEESNSSANKCMLKVSVMVPVRLSFFSPAPAPIKSTIKFFLKYPTFLTRESSFIFKYLFFN